jgi:hypothetical protein
VIASYASAAGATVAVSNVVAPPQHQPHIHGLEGERGEVVVNQVMRASALLGRKAAASALGDIRRVILRKKVFLQHVADLRFIVDDQDRGLVAHRRLPCAVRQFAVLPVVEPHNKSTAQNRP